jgi:hypothetical protein
MVTLTLARSIGVTTLGWRTPSPVASWEDTVSRFGRVYRSRSSPRSLRSLAVIKTHLDSNDLTVQFPALVRGHTRGDNSSTNTTCPSQRGLARQEDVGDVLVFTQEWQVEENLDGFGV